ncbi:hypothetical protein ACFVUN_35945 [Kitasatospora griseola]|uniref:hypothetical protein n=1 Tax=Kitasatospora griseola TaxID=2064 RepID=UPI0036D84F1B
MEHQNLSALTGDEDGHGDGAAGKMAANTEGPTVGEVTVPASPVVHGRESVVSGRA